MKTLQIAKYISVLLASTFGFTGVYAGSSATNNVTADIPIVNEISVTGAVTITVATPTAGGKTGGTGTVGATNPILRLTTNETNKRVTVSLDNALPTGVTLGVKLAANNSGLSTTELTSITTTAANLLTGISNLSTDEHDASGIALTYTLYLTEAAAPAHGANVLVPVVTYTITS
ncbi:MAG: hypothetical protein QM715_00475 [Nibricoccus sp.]